ncbi:MAG TPA: YggT family protein [Tepiditoga sp.]|nr:YggT family protein [Tepiditoga sp.]
MFVFSNLFYATASILKILINFLELSIIISSVLSFIMPYNHPIRNFFDSITYFMTNPIKKIINLNFGMFDFTPFIALLILIFTDQFIVQTLFDIARRLG